MNTNNPMQWTMQAKLNAVNDVSNDLTNDAEALLMALHDFNDTMLDMQAEDARLRRGSEAAFRRCRR